MRASTFARDFNRRNSGADPPPLIDSPSLYSDHRIAKIVLRVLFLHFCATMDRVSDIGQGGCFVNRRTMVVVALLIVGGGCDSLPTKPRRADLSEPARTVTGLGRAMENRSAPDRDAPARTLTNARPLRSRSDLARDLRVAEGRVLIRLKAARSVRSTESGIASAVSRAEVIEAIDVLRSEGVRIDYVFATLPMIATQVQESDLERLLALAVVDHIEPSGTGTLEGLPAAVSTQDTTWGLPFVRAPAAWAPGSGLGNRGSFATVTMIDSGLDSLHLTVGDGPTAASLASCFYVQLDSFPTPDSQTGCKSLGSHGPHVAGIINSTDNNIFFVGVAPELMQFNSIRVCENVAPFRCRHEYVVAALDWVAAYGGARHIVNLSLGYCFYSSALDEAVQGAIAAGALLVASSGNRWSDDPDCSPTSPNQLSITDLKWPARFPGVLSVGGIMSDSSPPALGPKPTSGGGGSGGGGNCEGPDVCVRLPQPCPQAGYGSRYGNGVDLVAPFESWSLGRWDPTSATYTAGDSHYCGTSQSAAFVTGVAALAWTRYPTYNAEQLKYLLRSSARQVGNLRIVDALSAAQQSPLALGVSIIGPTNIEVEGAHSWTASVTNAQSTPAFAWSYSASARGPFSQVGTGVSYVQFVGSGPPTEFWLRVQASDQMSSSTATVHVTNNAVNPCYPLVCLRGSTP